MNVIERLKSFAVLKLYSFLTALVLTLSVLLSSLGALGNILIQTIVSVAIVLGTLLELFQVLIVIQLANREDRVGWFLRRFAYLTLLVMVFSFLSIVGGTYLSSFFILGGDVMIVAVIGYVMQASFGICLASISYHFLQIEDAWS